MELTVDTIQVGDTFRGIHNMHTTVEIKHKDGLTIKLGACSGWYISKENFDKAKYSYYDDLKKSSATKLPTPVIQNYFVDGDLTKEKVDIYWNKFLNIR